MTSCDREPVKKESRVMCRRSKKEARKVGRSDATPIEPVIVEAG